MLVRSPVPLYFQIANELETRIASGDYAVGALLPSEQQLAKQFGVSLITVRGAMRTLIDKGLVARQPGKGTVVRRQAVRSVWELGWLGELITSVLTSRLELVFKGFRKPPAWAAAKLGVQRTVRLHTMRTVRHAVGRADEPFMMSDIYHPATIAACLEDVDFESPSVGAKLVILTVEEKCGITVAGVRQTMTAELADAESARLLRVDPGHPLLVVMRDYVDAFGRPMQIGLSKYRTDHYEYILNISRGSARTNPPQSHPSAGPWSSSDDLPAFENTAPSRRTAREGRSRDGSKK